MLSLKSSSEKNYELGGYIGNTLGHTLLAQPGTAQRFSPMSFISRLLQHAKWPLKSTPIIMRPDPVF